MGSNKQGSRVFSNANDNTKNQLTPKSDYYIDPSETSESFKSPLILSGSHNYPKWYRATVRGFTLKKKLGFADGKIAVPTKDHPMYGAWKQCNELVLSWILKAVSPEIAKSVREMGNAVDVWRNLKERFSPGDQFMISDILEEIYSLRQGERDLGSYFIEFGVLWNELELLRPLPVCTCVATKCSCGAMQRVMAQREQEKVGRFLKGLDDQRFVAIRSRIMREDPLPPIDKVYISVSQVVLEETQMVIVPQQSQPVSTSNEASSETQPVREVTRTDKIQLDRSIHPCPLTLKPAGESYICSGCKQLGFGRSYRCESSECNDKCGVYVLHEDCANAAVDNNSPVRHPFFEKSNFLFRMKPPGYPRICDACRKDVKGFEYHCSDTSMDLHPCCLKLKHSASDGETVTLKLSKTTRTKCQKCRKVDKNNDKGWSYASLNGKHCYHVSCFKELIYEKYEKGHFFKKKLPMVTYDNPETRLEAAGKKEMVKVRGSSSGSGTIKMVCKIASVVFKLIFSVIFGDPISLVLGLVEALAPAMG